MSTAVMAHIADVLRWPRWKRIAVTAGICVQYAYDRAAGWRRMVSLRTPARRNALGGAPTEAEFA